MDDLADFGQSLTLKPHVDVIVGCLNSFWVSLSAFQSTKLLLWAWTMLGRPLFFTSCKYPNAALLVSLSYNNWRSIWMVLPLLLFFKMTLFFHLFKIYLVQWMRWSTPLRRSEAMWRRLWWTTHIFSCGTLVARSPLGHLGTHITQTQR